MRRIDVHEKSGPIRPQVWHRWIRYTIRIYLSEVLYSGMLIREGPSTLTTPPRSDIGFASAEKRIVITPAGSFVPSTDVACLDLSLARRAADQLFLRALCVGAVSNTAATRKT